MSSIRYLRNAALNQMGTPIYPESILEPGEDFQAKENEHIKTLWDAFNVLSGRQAQEQPNAQMQEVVQKLLSQCQRHLPPGNALPHAQQTSAALACLSRAACRHDKDGRYREADLADAALIRLAQSALSGLANQGLQGISGIGNGVANMAGGAWNVGQALNPVNWAVAAGDDAVSGVDNWFHGKVNDAVDQRMRNMGFDPTTLPTGQHTGAPSSVTVPAPGASPAASSTTPMPSSASSVGEDASLVTRYLGWAFDAISRKRLPSATVRADLASYLTSNRQSPAFTQTVLQQFDARIGNQQAVKRQDAELSGGR